VTSDTTQHAAGPSANGAPPEDQAGIEGRNRSTIAFPYGSLKDAEQIATALQEHFGGSTAPEGLAASLESSMRSGAFRVKIATAKTFGVVTVERGKVSLSPLGQRIIDSEQRSAARVQAFLHVPLFDRLYNEYKDSPLPPDTGLEKKMADLGVSVKQTAKARQAFMRSADLAGFFKHGRKRLVLPPTNLADSSGKNPENDRNSLTLTGSSTALQPLVEAALLTLLTDGSAWSAEKIKAVVDSARQMHEALSKS
jgi:hypothetical protein